MPFLDKTSILIEHSTNNSLSIFELDDNIIYTNIDSSGKNVNSKILINGKYSFIDIWLDIDKNENIYGLLNNKKGKIENLTLDNDTLKRNTIIKYDHKNFIIKFAYTKSFSDENHIIYYSINKENPYYAYLIHIYVSPNITKKTRIDFVNYNILSNFSVTYNNNIPTIFYFKIVNYTEELFMSTFNIDSYTWSPPIQITNSKKGKIYLSVIKDYKNNHHIVFAENNGNKYFCKYTNGNIINDNLDILTEKYISNHTMCVFPNIISNCSKIYIQWIEYFDLYICESSDFGKTWSEPYLNSSISDLSFKRYEYRSSNNTYNANNVFALKNYNIIL